MKKNKKSIIIVALVLIILVEAIFFVVIYNSKKTNLLCMNATSNKKKIDQNAKYTIICSKKIKKGDEEATVDYLSEIKYYIVYDDIGKVQDYYNEYILAYPNDDVFKANKDAQVNVSSKFDDEKLTKTDEYKMYDDNETDIWYYPIIKELETKGYTCE